MAAICCCWNSCAPALRLPLNGVRTRARRWRRSSLRPQQWRRAQSCKDVWESLKAFLLALGDDVQMKELEHYVAFRRLKNFACVKLRGKDLQVWTKLDPSSITLEEGFTRDVSQLGHAGTGDLEIRIQTASDFERARPLLLRSYQGA
jgi:predicted transport protein